MATFNESLAKSMPMTFALTSAVVNSKNKQLLNTFELDIVDIMLPNFLLELHKAMQPTMH